MLPEIGRRSSPFYQTVPLQIYGKHILPCSLSYGLHPSTVSVFFYPWPHPQRQCLSYPPSFEISAFPRVGFLFSLPLWSRCQWRLGSSVVSTPRLSAGHIFVLGWCVCVSCVRELRRSRPGFHSTSASVFVTSWWHDTVHDDGWCVIVARRGEVLII